MATEACKASDYTVERYSERGHTGWIVVHAPTGESWGHVHRTEQDAERFLDKLMAEPEVWYVSYLTSKAFGRWGIGWVNKAFTNEGEARAFAATLPRHKVEHLILDGARYRTERLTF